VAYKSIFKRYELKYLLTREQHSALLRAMEPYMKLDEFGHSTIRNIYFDTENFRLIRRSIEKPAYKEKLRIRSYQQANPESPVFIELKKKYDGIVYKRRMTLPEAVTMDCLIHQKPLPKRTQIAEEIEYFLNYYKSLAPAVFLSYEREAFFALDGSDFRVTFDENILFRAEDLSLQSNVYGTPILKEDQVLMEIKTSGGYPLWMVKILSDLKLYKNSFSKYGSAYKMLLAEKKNTNPYLIADLSEDQTEKIAV